MKGKNVVFYFVSENFAYNDPFIPIVLKLAEQGCQVYTIFFKIDNFRDLKVMKPYYKWLKLFTLIKIVDVPARSPLFSYLLSKKKLLILMARMMLSKGYIAFFHAKEPTKEIQILNFVARIRGKAILYTAYYENYYGRGYTRDGVDLSREKELYLKYSSQFKLLDRKYSERFDKNIVVKERKKRPFDALLVYHDGPVEGFEYATRKILIKYPKLNPWWTKFINEYPPVFDNPRIQKEAYIAVFLTHFGNYYFKEGIDLDDLLNDIIRAIRFNFPKILIVVKPKITTDLRRLGEILKRLDDSNIVTTNVPVSLLSDRSVCGITTCQTTAQFEFVSEKSPWIEYGVYSKWWKEVYPPISFTEKYGGFLAVTFTELRNLLDGIENKPFNLCLFKKTTGYFDKEIDFDLFYSGETSGS